MEPLIFEQEHVVKERFGAMAARWVVPVVCMALVFLRLPEDGVKVYVFLLHQLYFLRKLSTVEITI